MLFRSSRLEEFGRKHQISQKTIINMQHVFEELVMQSLIKELPQQFDLTFSVEYSEESGAAEMRMSFDGNELDPLKKCDEISGKIVENAVASYEHSYVDGRNRVKILIK